MSPVYASESFCAILRRVADIPSTSGREISCAIPRAFVQRMRARKRRTLRLRRPMAQGFTMEKKPAEFARAGFVSRDAIAQ